MMEQNLEANKVRGGGAAAPGLGAGVSPTPDLASRLGLNSWPERALQSLDLPLCPLGHTEGISQEVCTMGLLLLE